MINSIQTRLVRVFVGNNKAEIAVWDFQSNKPRLIVLTWMSKGPPTDLPDSWFDMVEKEVAFQRSQELSGSPLNTFSFKFGG